ncbi:MAG: zf-HC2 domain-containing protein [Candidatus Baltobacteraceae bacterium]
MSRRHVGELAALYALGALDEAERTDVDSHAASCDACAASLAGACDDVAGLEASYPLAEPPWELSARVAALLDRGVTVPLQTRRPSSRWNFAFAAIAAVLILAFVPSAYLWQQNAAMHGEMLAQSAALSRIMTSPHRMALFASTTDARVMYAKDGSWYCIIVRGARGPVDVAWKHDGRVTILGRAVPRGEIAMLYLPKSHRMQQLALMDSSTDLGDARLVF